MRLTSLYLRQNYHNYRHGTKFNPYGFRIFDEDWDNLIILDSCRYDYFEQYSDLPGRLEARISRGSMSKEFVCGNFQNQHHYDTVYFSDNVFFGKLKDKINANLHHYSLSERDAFDGLVSHPSTVTESAKAYDERFPNKRLIVHYMQPHAPYFGVDGRERFEWPSENYNDCNPEELKQAYTENLRLVLSEAERLLDSLTGKTVITADHGELLGERLLPIPVRYYQHPAGVYVEELLKVPWLIIDSANRKEIIEESPPKAEDSDELNSDEIEDQLKALGYK